MASPSQKKNVPLQQVLTALLDEQNVFPVSYLQHFSDLEGKDLEAFRSVWPHVRPGRRLSLMQDLEDLTETDTLVSFDNVARLALEDSDPRVRAVAIRLLWEAEDPRLAKVFMRMLDEDADTGVRAAAANALGQFVYMGEVEEIPQDALHEVEESLLGVVAGPDEPLVRRRALESLGFSGRPEVPGLIRNAYASEDSDWRSSALVAMGRSADQAWGPDVLRMLRYPKANVQLQAVKAAGALELEASRRILLDLLEEEAQDSEIRAAVIWSLSQIGGEEVRETLEQIMEETEDEEEMEVLEDALDNLSFTEDVGMYGLFDFANLGQPNRELDIESYDSEIEDQEETNESADANSESDEDRDRKPGDKRPRHRRSS